jgi:hypothetical protein
LPTEAVEGAQDEGQEVLLADGSRDRLLPFRREQTSLNMAGHLAEGRLGDVLTIDGSHVLRQRRVPHDVVDRDLIAGETLTDLLA